MTPAALIQMMDATWPAADFRRLGPWLIRDGQGGGKRVSAASVAAPIRPQDIEIAAAAMRAMGQRPLFLLRQGDDDLDNSLATLGYEIIDPVIAYSVDTAMLEPDFFPESQSFAHWPPLAIATELWADAGIGPARVAVMHRAIGPKTAILVRGGDRAAGVCFAAMKGATVMIHALEVAIPYRRQGSAQILLHAAARWAIEHGAARLSLVVTAGNAPARALYGKLGMQMVGAYHYRQLPNVLGT